MGDRGQVYIGKIIDVKPIDGADFLEHATVVCGEGGKWSGVVKKGDFKVDSLARVFLPDSQLPQTEEFAFMEKYHYRVRQQKFKGVASEVLILPIPSTWGYYGDTSPTGLPPSSVGGDITNCENVTKYEKPLPASLAGVAKGNFPQFIPKTDEPNFQGAWGLVRALKGKEYYVTTKVDGSSGTVYYKDGHFGVCSRNLELKETADNSFWKVVRELDLESKMTDFGKNIAFQFELAGEGIQKNRLGLKGHKAFFFNVYLIDERVYGDFYHLCDYQKHFGFEMVPVIALEKQFTFETAEELQNFAEGTYPNGSQREGVVFRPTMESVYHGVRVSFKVINLKYKGD